IFLAIELVEVPILKDSYFKPNPGRIPYTLAISLIVIVIWFTLGTWLAPYIGKLLAESPIIRGIIIGSNTIYFEEKKEGMLKADIGHILSRFFNLFIVWAALSATITSLVANLWYETDPERLQEFLESTSQPDVFLKSLLLIAIAPLAITLLIPVSWMLIDVQIKALSKRRRTVWFLGTKIQDKVRIFIAVGAIVTAAGVLGFENWDLLVHIIILSIARVGLACTLIVLMFTALFHIDYRKDYVNRINIPFGETNVLFKERKNSPKMH
ncbi:MAG: hypothetical protein ACFFGZ_11810, partial [Candidatus Thorarchaeota archaeon]